MPDTSQLDPQSDPPSDPQTDPQSDRPHRLLVMRHAKAASPDGEPSDWGRPLAPRGRRDAPGAGAWLAGAGWVPDLILSSDAVRARQTTELVMEGLASAGAPEPSLQYVSGLYEASVHQVLHVVADVAAGVATVMVVGHEPTMSAVTAALTGKRVEFPTSAVAQIELSGTWSEVAAGAGSLVGVRTPR
jgi:phosphohistidine phosphatase